MVPEYVFRRRSYETETQDAGVGTFVAEEISNASLDASWREGDQSARTALIRAHAIGATIGFARTAPRSRWPTIPCPSARQPPNKRPATTRRSMN